MRNELVESRTKIEQEKTENSEMSQKLESLEKELQEEKRKRLEVEGGLKKAHDDLLNLAANLLGYLTESQKFDQAKKVYNNIVQLYKNPEMNVGRIEDILTVKDKFIEVQMMNGKYSDAEELAANVLKERGDIKNDKYQASFRRRYEVVLKQEKSEWKAAGSWLKKEYDVVESQGDLGIWRLEVGDMYCHVLGELGQHSDAIYYQQRIVEERNKRQEKTDMDVIRSTLRLARLHLAYAKELGVEYKRQYSESAYVDYLSTLQDVCKLEISVELAKGIRDEIYEGACYYVERDNWSRATEFLDVVFQLEETTTSKNYLDNPSRTKLLEAFAARYRDPPTTTPLAEKVLQKLYTARMAQCGETDSKTLDCAYELSQLINKQCDGSKHEIARLMKIVFFGRRRQLRKSDPAPDAFLREAFFFGCIVRKLAGAENVDHLDLGGKAELYQMAELAFQTVWDNRSKNMSFPRETFIEAGENLVRCLNDQQLMKRRAAPAAAKDIWALSGTQSNQMKRLQLGCSIGGLLREMETNEADDQAAVILWDVWNDRETFTVAAMGDYGFDLGICLTRSSRYEQGRDVLDELRRKISDAAPKSPKIAYYLAYCLMALGRYNDAASHCSLATQLGSSTADADADTSKATWAIKALDRITKSQQDEQEITTHLSTIAEKNRTIEAIRQENNAPRSWRATATLQPENLALRIVDSKRKGRSSDRRS